MFMLLVAAIPVSLFVPFGDMFKLTPEQWMWMILIGVFSTGFAYLLWGIASKRLNVVPLTLNLIYIGIITVISEVIFLHLSLDWKYVLGGLMMIFASIAAELVNKKANDYLAKRKIPLI